MTQIIRTDGTRQKICPANGTDFTLKEMQAIVGGNIELVELDEKTTMVVNEEGKLLGMPYNAGADREFHSRFPSSKDFIDGNVLICNNNQIR